MPRYKYRCAECEIFVTVYHGINETLLDCKECSEKQTMTKVLSTPIIIKDKKTNDNNKVGDLTEQYIEENRKILEQQKEEARNEQ